MEVPSGAWEEADVFHDHPPVAADWRLLPGLVEHGFTHLRLELQVRVARIDGRKTLGGVWIPVETFGDHALPTLTRKLVRHVMAHLGRPDGE